MDHYWCFDHLLWPSLEYNKTNLVDNKKSAIKKVTVHFASPTVIGYESCDVISLWQTNDIISVFGHRLCFASAFSFVGWGPSNSSWHWGLGLCSPGPLVCGGRCGWLLDKQGGGVVCLIKNPSLLRKGLTLLRPVMFSNGCLFSPSLSGDCLVILNSPSTWAPRPGLYPSFNFHTCMRTQIRSGFDPH